MPTFDAGSIEAKLTLDRSQFNRELRQAKADAAAFERDPITKKVRADKREYDKVADQVRRDSKKLGEQAPKVDIKGDKSDWEKDFRDTLREAEELSRKTADVRIDADVRTLRARAEVAALDEELDNLNNKRVEPKIKIDEGGVLTRRVSILTTALIGLSPAAVPAITGITAATLGLVGALGAATPAVGIFGAALVGNVASAIEMNKELTKLEEKLKGTGDAAERAELIAQIGKMTREMSPAIRDFIGDIDDLSSAWKDFTSATESESLRLAGRAVQVLANALIPLAGVADELAPAFSRWLSGIEEFVYGDGYREFLGFIMKEGPRALDNVGRLMGSLTVAVGGLVRSFAPFGQDFLEVLAEGAERFATWASQLGQTAGFRSFIDYVNQTGPQLVDTLGAIGDAAIDIGQALAPLGGPTLTIIRLFAESLSAVADVAPGLIPLALGLYTVGRAAAAFGDLVQAGKQKLDNFVAATGKAPENVGRLRGALSGALGIIGGPWGLALAGGITALGLFADRHAKAKQRSDDLKASLDQTTGAITAQSSALIKTELIESGAVKTAREFGINLADLQLAAEGNEPAFRKVNAQIDTYINNQVAASGENVRMDKGLVDLSRRAQDLRRTLGGTNKTIAEQRDVIRDTAALSGGYIDATSGLKFATEAEAQAHADAGKAIERQRDALATLLSQQRASREEALRLASAEINYEQALDDAQEAAKKNGETHDITTQKGRDNERMLIALGDAQQKLTDDTKFMALSAKDQIAVMEDQRKQFISVAEDMGYTKEEAAALADQYLKLPKEVTTRAELEAQQDKLDEWKTNLDGVNDQITTITELILDNAGLQAWDDDLDGIPDSVDTETKVDPDKPGLSLWNELLNDLPEEKETDGSIRADYEELRRWQASIDALHGKTVTLRTNREIYTYRVTTYSTRRGAQIGNERGGVIDALNSLPAFQDGGTLIDMRYGGVQPGFSAKDNRIGLFRDGEGVLIPEAVDRLGGPPAIEAINDAARAGAREGTTELGSPIRGAGINIEKLIVQNPVGEPTEDTILDRVADLNVMFS